MMEHDNEDDFDTKENFNKFWDELRKAGPAEAEELTYEKWKSRQLTRQVRSAEKLRKAARAIIPILQKAIFARNVSDFDQTAMMEAAISLSEALEKE